MWSSEELENIIGPWVLLPATVLLVAALAWLIFTIPPSGGPIPLGPAVLAALAGGVLLGLTVAVICVRKICGEPIFR